MGVRTELAEHLKATLPDVDVIGYSENLDVVRRPTVLVWQEKVTRPDLFALGAGVQVDLTAWVLVGAETPEKADDALDDALVKVLFALDPIVWLQWTTAERGVFAGQFHGYKITATAVATITPDEGA